MAKALGPQDDSAVIAERVRRAPEVVAKREAMTLLKAPKKWSEMTPLEQQDIVRIIGTRLGFILPE